MTRLRCRSVRQTFSKPFGKSKPYERTEGRSHARQSSPRITVGGLCITVCFRSKGVSTSGVARPLNFSGRGERRAPGRGEGEQDDCVQPSPYWQKYLIAKSDRRFFFRLSRDCLRSQATTRGSRSVPQACLCRNKIASTSDVREPKLCARPLDEFGSGG